MEGGSEAAYMQSTATVVDGTQDTSLRAYGWDADWAAAFAAHAPAGAVPGRVLVEYRRIYDLVTPRGMVRAVPAGRLRQGAAAGEAPAVGDWVWVRLAPDGTSGLIEGILPRRSAFVRQNPGTERAPQVIAANIDTVFIVDALDRPPNLRRLERYLVLAWESGARPVLVLSKADLCADVPGAVAQVQTIAADVPVLACSAVTGEGLAALAAYLQEGRTLALLGPSGVGKSTLVNHFCGAPVQAVGAVRERDRKGRHTTTRRQLLRTPQGALVVDTPGMRELQLWEASDGLDRAFPDIEALAAECYFSDCQHRTEPECAVLAAVAAGTLSPERLASYHKLQSELAAAQARRDPAVGARGHRSSRAPARPLPAAPKRRPSR